ncbi:protein DEK-like isoform X1 [Iris pallida]|uniref:Protein DEK-like isoform X1 n=1 Tax=Iris pallida TaxID=29817 RepID=A0AAX6DGH5_IRIPA|nr:protein DEK-like isoform X1 [Iris pallida]
MAKSKEVVEEEEPPAAQVKNTEEEEQAMDQDQKSEKKRKRGRQKKEEETKSKKKKKKQKEAVERPEERWPARERRQVVRFSVPTPQRVSLPKNPKIEQGPGTKLGDIPNVIFKLSKRKADDNLNVLHTIIFRRKSKVHFLKRNILQFSGYVWSGNEEKERTKVKEKLDKCTKDKLVDFCQLFDIPLNKSIIKKEEVSAKLMEFLESPYVTRDVILAEKTQQREKRKRTKVVKQDTSEGKSSDGGYKKRKGTPGSKMKKGRTYSSNVDEVVGEDTEKEKGETDDKLPKSVPRKKTLKRLKK